MAHWGQALDAWGNPFAGGPAGPALDRGVRAAARAAARPLPTPVEQGFVSAVAALYREAQATPSAGRLQAYADTLEGTDKHPVTPAKLLPVRELQADMLLAAGRYREALAAYRATLAREPRRARSSFGAGRAAQLAGDSASAARWYREYLGTMEPGDGRRRELATARGFLGQ
jgi:hypothetical protein